RGEPVLPPDRPDPGRRTIGERVALEQMENGGGTLQQAQLGAHDPRILAPLSQGSEPEIPFESRLVGRIDAGWLHRILRLVAEGVRSPLHAVARALKLDLPALAGHPREQPVTVPGPERLGGRGGPTEGWGEPLRDARCEDEGRVEDPSERDPRRPRGSLRLHRRCRETEAAVIEQQYAETEDDVVQERVVRAEDDPDLEGRGE